MLEFLEAEANRTETENGAAANITTGSDCLDFFATVGAMREASEHRIIKKFVRAFSENRDSAMKIFFFARDIRGGLGERRVFRVILKWLALNEPKTVRKNLKYISEYGRFDDLLTLIGTPCEKDMIALVKEQLSSDLLAAKNGGEISLLAKWLPSVNASNKTTVLQGKHIARMLNMTDAEYRKALSLLRAKIAIIENNLRERDYTFDYEKQPSRAMFKYKEAFYRNDGKRYREFLSRVERGEAVLHADNISPYELIQPYLDFDSDFSDNPKEMSEEEKATLNATWDSLPDYTCHDKSNGNTLAVIDTSGSMYSACSPMPAAVALSLGLYFAEHNTGIYKNRFIEFSSRPQLIEIKGETFVDRLRYLTTFNEVADTNLEAVFDLILYSAVKNNLPASELPSRLIIISDMEFNCCVENADLTNFENAKQKFESYGYKLPEIVFWNVASRNDQQPVTANEQGVTLISGATPRLFSMVADGSLSPYTFMKELLTSERYAQISA